MLRLVKIKDNIFVSLLILSKFDEICLFNFEVGTGTRKQFFSRDQKAISTYVASI